MFELYFVELAEAVDDWWLLQGISKLHPFLPISLVNQRLMRLCPCSRRWRHFKLDVLGTERIHLFEINELTEPLHVMLKAFNLI